MGFADFAKSMISKAEHFSTVRALRKRISLKLFMTFNNDGVELAVGIIAQDKQHPATMVKTGAEKVIRDYTRHTRFPPFSFLLKNNLYY